MYYCKLCGATTPGEHSRYCPRFKEPPKNLGVNVKMLMSFPGHHLHEQTLHNVTEIHYNYETASGSGCHTERIAFESDIHGTGVVYDREHVYEFETEPAMGIFAAF